MSKEGWSRDGAKSGLWDKLEHWMGEGSVRASLGRWFGAGLQLP